MNFKLRVKKYLNSQGYKVYGISNSVDSFIVISEDTVWLQKPMYVRCIDRRNMDEEEQRELYERAIKHGCIPIIAYRNKKDRLRLEEIKY